VLGQFWSSFDFLESSKEEKENPEVVNISKKPIKESKWMEKAQKVFEVQVAQKVQEAQVVKNA
jgi:hypothetical protein